MALDIICTPNAHTLSLAQVPREVGRRDALEEALLLLLDIGGIDRRVRHRWDVHDSRVLLADVLLLDGVNDVLHVRNSVSHEQRMQKSTCNTNGMPEDHVTRVDLRHRDHRLVQPQMRVCLGVRAWANKRLAV